MGVDPGFITDVGHPAGVAVDSAHVYWPNQQGGGGRIWRANLDGTHVERRFITRAGRPVGLAVGPGSG